MGPVGTAVGNVLSSIPSVASAVVSKAGETVGVVLNAVATTAPKAFEGLAQAIDALAKLGGGA